MSALPATLDVVLILLSEQGGGLGCNWAETRVMSLAWNDRDQVLYIGGDGYTDSSDSIRRSPRHEAVALELYSIRWRMWCTPSERRYARWHRAVAPLLLMLSGILEEVLTYQIHSLIHLIGLCCARSWAGLPFQRSSCKYACIWDVSWEPSDPASGCNCFTFDLEILSARSLTLRFDLVCHARSPVK